MGKDSNAALRARQWFYAIPAGIWSATLPDGEPLPALAKTVYCYLWSRASKEATAFPGIKRIASECSISELYDAVTLRRKKAWRLPRFFVEKFFSVYDTYRIVRPVDFPSTEREYIKFLDAVEGAVRRSPAIQRRDIPLDPFFMVKQV